jgi:PHD/YefM family antitoxin component YafN of YafNO toxin-antitoxin module
MATIENVSATNMRVNLTDIIDGLSVDTAVAVTKHKKVIAYVLSPETYNGLMGIEEVEEDEASPSGLETVMGALSEVEPPAHEPGDLDGIPHREDDHPSLGSIPVSAEVLMDIYDESREDDEEVEVDAGELAGETTPGPNYEPDPDLDGDFDSFLEELQNETLDRLKATG